MIDYQPRDWHHAFDPSDPRFGDDFDAICDDLVATCPVARTVEGEWVLSRHSDVTRVLQDWETFSSAAGIRGVAYQPPPEELLRPNEMDPPTHAWLRSSWNRHFTPQAVSEHEPEIRRIIRGLADGFVADNEVELVSQFSDPVACASFCQAVAHMPAADMPFLQTTFQAALAGGSLEERGENWGKAQAYMAEFLAQRRREERQDDIVDTILHFQYKDGRPYDEGEQAAGLTQVAAAGLVTTGAVISGAVHHLATHPDDQELLASDPSRLPVAVEEFLRFFPAAPFIGRKVIRDVEIAGTLISAGEYVWYNVGGANRDPSVVTDPGELRIDRTPNPHLSFATGVHRCLGAHFARLNILISIETLLRRCSGIRLQPGFTAHFEGGMTRRMTSLRLEFSACPGD